MKKGLNTLEQLIRDRTEEFVEELFSSYLTVSEKIDAARISFQVRDGKLSIWRKDERYPISIIDRTLMKYYEKAIDHITSIINVAVIPENYRFGCYYFSSSMPNKTHYKRLPKNNIVLTDVKIYDEDGIKIKDDRESINYWATELRIEPAPIIFEGYLTDKQKEKILHFIKLTPKELSEKYDTTSFTQFLIKILNPALNSSFLQEMGIYRPDSIIFKFKSQRGNTFVAKTVDPLIVSNAEINSEIPESSVPSDLYSIALIDIYMFMLENGLNYALKERTPEFRYIEFICLLFNDFIEKNLERYENVDFSEPSFLKSKDFELNKKFIENTRTLELIKMNHSYEQLFKIMLAGLRKKRRRPYGLLTLSIINQLNLIIDQIAELVDIPLSEGFMDFSTFRIFRDDLFGKEADPSTMMINYDPDEIKKKTATIVCLRPTIMTKSIESKIKNLSEFDRVFFIQCPPHDPMISNEIIDMQLDNYFGQTRDLEGHFRCEHDNEIEEILNGLKQDYEIESVCTSTDNIEWLRGVLNNEIGDLGYFEDEDAALNYLQDDDFSRFKSICPSYVNSNYMRIQKDLEKKKKIDYKI